MRVGRRWYRQRRGIAQGSLTSTLLCSLYLAALEAEHLAPLLPPAGGEEAGEEERAGGWQRGCWACVACAARATGRA